VSEIEYHIQRDVALPKTRDFGRSLRVIFTMKDSGEERGKNVKYARVVPVPLYFGNRKNRSLWVLSLLDHVPRLPSSSSRKRL